MFLDLIDIYTDTKITKIGAFIAKLQTHPVFRAAILNFLRENPELRFGSRHFWIQHTRKPPDANFYASIRKCTPNSHIRPTIGYFAEDRPRLRIKPNYNILRSFQNCLKYFFLLNEKIRVPGFFCFCFFFLFVSLCVCVGGGGRGHITMIQLCD